MPPKTRHRSRSDTASTSGRVTRSQARSDTSHEGSEAAGTEERRASGAVKPDVKSEVSLAYGSPQRSKVPNRLASQIRQRNIEGVIEDAVHESANAVVQDQDRDSSVAGSRLSDIEEANTEDDSTVQGSPNKQALVGQTSISFNVEAPVGRSAGFDENGYGTRPDRLSARNLRRINRDSSSSSDDYVEQMIEKMSSSYSPDTPSPFSTNNLMKVLLFGSFLAISLMTLLSTNGISNAGSHITRDLKTRVHGILSPAVINPLGNWTDGVAAQFDTVSVQLGNLKDRIENVNSRMTSHLSSIQSRIDTVRDDAEKREFKYIGGVNAFAVGSGLLVDPYLTSPTKRVQEKYWLGPLYRAFLGAPVIRPHTPYAAFQPWEDHGDCWCAAAADGHAQISIVLPRGVLPKRLEIEHINHVHTPDPGATPKEFELWTQIEDPAQRERAEVAARWKYGTPHERHGSLPALKDNWVRILSGTYDGKTIRRNQKYYLPDMFPKIPPAGVNPYPRRFTLRINSIWGPHTDHACLYRVKLFGESPEYEKIFDGAGMMMQMVSPPPAPQQQ